HLRSGVTAGTHHRVDPAHSLAPRDPDAPFGIYLHVPFCSTRCGYCDFNTYTAGELGSATSPVDWERAPALEIDRAAEILAGSGRHRPWTRSSWAAAPLPSSVRT